MLPLSTRAVGLIPFLRDLLPPAAIDAFAALTWLGSVPVVIALLTFAYWFGPRRRGAVGIAVILAAFAVTLGLKALFGLPRPPMSLRWVEATGFGFPSGHAIAATAGWGYLALVHDRWSVRRRASLAALVILTVALSRVVIGVHYAVDVVAGIVVGLAVLALVTRTERPDVAFGLAVVAALFAVVLTQGGGDAVLLVGAAGSGGLLWSRLAVPTDPWGREDVIPAAGGGAGVGALAIVGYRWDLTAPIELVVGVLTVSVVLALPLVVERVRGER